MQVPPEPLSDPSKAAPDSTKDLNLADPNHPDYGKMQFPERGRLGQLPESSSTYIHKYWGTGINYYQNALRAYAGHEVRPDLQLPSVPAGKQALVLYAPTLLPPNNSPAESVTIYRRYSGSSSTQRAWGVYNHVSGSWTVWKAIDATFLSKYVRNFPEWGGQLYYTEIDKVGPNTWSVYLYNFNTSLWEIQTTITGTGPYANGWDFWEIYLDQAWPSLPDIEASGIRIYVNGSWQLVTPTYGYEAYECCMPYYRYFSPQYHRWYVGPYIPED